MPRKKVVKDENEGKENLNFTPEDISNKLKKLKAEEKKKQKTLKDAQDRYDKIEKEIDEEVNKISEQKETSRRMFAAKILDCLETAYGKEIPEDKYGAIYYAFDYQETTFHAFTNAIENNKLTGSQKTIPLNANEEADKAINNFKARNSKRLDELFEELEAVDKEVNNILSSNDDSNATTDETKTNDDTTSATKLDGQTMADGEPEANGIDETNQSDGNTSD